MDGSCKSADALHDSNLCVSLASTAVGIPNYVRAADSTASSSRADVGSPTGCEPSSSNRVSSRIGRMMQRRSKYASAVEFEIDASKDHWSQMDPTSALETVNETDLEVYQSLREKWGHFFCDWSDDLVVGEKIAEGGQAEIFNAEVTYTDGIKDECVVKVFKEGFSLRDLEKQWPHGMLKNLALGTSGYYTSNSCPILDASLLRNGRFAFKMLKYWGDLRKLIDFRMQHNHNEFPPFTNEEVGDIVIQIAVGMHNDNIIHRDLKASNVLIYEYIMGMLKFNLIEGKIGCNVADFECSIGVVGTRYWRFYERFLRAAQDRNFKPHLFTKKADVYSYAMTCYEVLTGHIPFEDLGGNCYNIVIEGGRPELPKHIDPLLETLFRRCWHVNPSKRPFKCIIATLIRIYPNFEVLSKFKKLKVKMNSCPIHFWRRA